MSCNPNVLTVVSLGMPEIKGFSVQGAVKITAYNLVNPDSVTFQRVQYCSKQPHFDRDGCALISPSKRELSSAIDYKIGICLPLLTSERNSLIIPYPGNYIPVVNGNPVDLMVEVESITTRNFSDKELGICPCGYSPSVPLPITLDEGDCCGSVFMGYLFHPNETRDPKATVEIRVCDGLFGYAYPEAGDGHTLPIEECGGKVIGYAANKSSTAPQQLVGC